MSNFCSNLFAMPRSPKTWSCLDSYTQYDSSIQGQLCSDIDSTRPSAQRNDRKVWGLSSKPLDKKPYCPHTRSCDGITQFIPPSQKGHHCPGEGVVDPNDVSSPNRVIHPSESLFGMDDKGVFSSSAFRDS